MDMQHHISQKFNEELEEVKSRMLQMGGLVERQVADCITAFMSLDENEASAIRKRDDKVNDLEISIDEECTRILARRQPAAKDLRMVIAITKAVSDLERMGDEAGKIAVSAMDAAKAGGLGRKHLEIRHIGDHVGRMVRDALDSFARLDEELALKVAKEDKSVDMEYATALRSLVTYMMEDPRSITAVLNVMWALRSLERIGDHARNIAEHVIFLVKGQDVRHANLAEMEEAVNG